MAAGVARNGWRRGPIWSSTPSGDISVRMSSTYSGNLLTASSADSALPPRRTYLVSGSVPGARPMPRSMRPGKAASSRANCSATTSGAWLGSITPPEPTLIRCVAAASIAMITGGLVDATAGMLWCSATQ